MGMGLTTAKKAWVSFIIYSLSLWPEVRRGADRPDRPGFRPVSAKNGAA
jgi:hypothetical protein